MHPSERSKAVRVAGPVGLGLLTALGVIALASVGLGPASVQSSGPLMVLMLLITAGFVPGAYLLGAFGIGRPLAAMLAPRSDSRLWIQLGLGLAAMLWLSHLLGMLGLLSGAGERPRIIGWAIPALGLLLLADQVVRGPLRPERWPVVPLGAMLWAPGIALLLVAASSPTGALWGSEFRAFDALSYHLQLPKEWAAGARLWPSDHNVYSYLPSLIESAYLHLGAMMPGPAEPVRRMLGGDGNWVIACQYLHAGITLIGSLLTARAAWTLARGCIGADGTDGLTARAMGVIAGTFMLATPWMIVTGSLPYNEGGMLALGAAGVLIAVDGRFRDGRTEPRRESAGWRPWARGTAAGIAVGVACGCKPTSLFMVGPLVGLLLLDSHRVREWPAMMLGGIAAGLGSIAPWLIRNWMACGDPVFPFAATLFGDGHWTAEQIARHARNHHAPPGMGPGERLGRLFSDEFGLLHAQWGIALPVMGAALIGALAWRRTRRDAAMLGLALMAQAACWMMLTHLQSRFLLPVLTTGAMLLALAGAGLVTWVRRSGSRHKALAACALGVLGLVPLSQALRSRALFMEQNDGAPNEFLVLGVAWWTGASIDSATGAERERLLAQAPPMQYVNVEIRPQETPDAGVYLLGDSTPLYWLGATGRDTARVDSRGGPSSPVVYNTTWDRPLLDDPALRGLDNQGRSRWLAQRGIRYVLVNFDELHRLIDIDHNYDPAITLPLIVDWVRSPEGHLRSIRAWRPAGAPASTGSELFEIDLPTPARAPDGARRP